jgi:hypothetical protein
MARRQPVELRARLNEKIRALQLDPGLVMVLAREHAHNMDLVSLDQLSAAETVELLVTLNTIETRRALDQANEETRELVAAG